MDASPKTVTNTITIDQGARFTCPNISKLEALAPVKKVTM